MSDIKGIEERTYKCDGEDCERSETVTAHLMFSRAILMRDYHWMCTSDDVGVIQDLCPIHARVFKEEIAWLRKSDVSRGSMPAHFHSTHPETGRYALEFNAQFYLCSVMGCPAKAYGVAGESPRATLERIKGLGWRKRRYGRAKLNLVLLCPDHWELAPERIRQN